MVIGECHKSTDLNVNPCGTKKLTNIRAANNDDAIKIIPPTKMGLEEVMAYMEDDEIIELTPQSIRLRKAVLDPSKRRSAARAPLQI